MSSRIYIVPVEHSVDAETWHGAATFIAPIKSVFGRELCDTDGSIGYPTEFGPERALEIIAKCTPTYPSDARDLYKIRRWAAAGKTLFAVWQH